MSNAEKTKKPQVYVTTEHDEYVVRAFGIAHHYRGYPVPFTGKNREQEMVQHAVGPEWRVLYGHGMRTYTAYELVPA